MALGSVAHAHRFGEHYLISPVMSFYGGGYAFACSSASYGEVTTLWPIFIWREEFYLYNFIFLWDVEVMIVCLDSWLQNDSPFSKKV